jgi:transcriptional regulator with XRE-family HTH domain
MDYTKIEELVKSKGWTLGGLAEKIGVTRAGFYRTLEQKTMKVETLEKIAQVLDVPVSEFFDTKDDDLEYDFMKQALSTQNDLLVLAMHLLFNVRTTSLRLYEGVVSLKKALEDEGQDTCFNHPAAKDLNRVIDTLSKDDRIYEQDEAITKFSEMYMTIRNKK